jgi:hypothetical protein
VRNAVFGKSRTFLKQMHLLSVVISVLCLLSSAAIQIPLIQNVTLVPLSSTNSTTFYNRTCDECLCLSLAAYAAFNCFSNRTCQFFLTVPLRYQLQPTSQARLYFSSRLFPNTSQCCMPNLSQVIKRLQNGTRVSANISDPRCLLIDNNEYVVTPDYSSAYLRRYNSTTLASIDQIQVTQSNPFSVIQHDGAYYVGLTNRKIMIINSINHTIISIMTTPCTMNLRDIMFLNNGQKMVAVCSGTNSLIFFQQSSSISTNYTFSYSQSLSNIAPHGLLYINDSFFYATSWQNNQIYSYAAINGTFWKETIVVNALPYVSGSDGNHVAVDECGRRWFAMGAAGLLIFDTNGALIGNYSQLSKCIFDAVLTENYVLYLSDYQSHQIFRIDPNIDC